jgi:hypothetical protein
MHALGDVLQTEGNIRTFMEHFLRISRGYI